MLLLLRDHVFKLFKAHNPTQVSAQDHTDSLIEFESLCTAVSFSDSSLNKWKSRTPVVNIGCTFWHITFHALNVIF